MENYTPAAISLQPRSKPPRRSRATPADNRIIIAQPLPATLEAETPTVLPMASWEKMDSFVAAVEHWLEHDAFSVEQIEHLLDERATPAMRAKLSMLWAFCDEAKRFRCDLEPALIAVRRLLALKLEDRREDSDRLAEVLREFAGRICA